MDLGSVLLQVGKLIAHASRQLKHNEVSYPTRNLKLATISYALKIWGCYYMVIFLTYLLIMKD